MAKRNKLEPIDIDNLVIQKKHLSISSTKTPSYYVKDKGGVDYVEEGYMRKMLNDYFPVWSWEVIKYEFIGDKAISVHGRLKIIDSGTPRSFDAVAAHRIAVSKKDGGYVDLGNDLKAANSDCFKVACNRLCNIADDIYRKAILSSEQLSTITNYLSLIDDTGKRNQIVSGIESRKINPTNYSKTITRLEELTKDNGGKTDE